MSSISTIISSIHYARATQVPDDAKSYEDKNRVPNGRYNNGWYPNGGVATNCSSKEVDAAINANTSADVAIAVDANAVVQINAAVDVDAAVEVQVDVQALFFSH